MKRQARDHRRAKKAARVEHQAVELARSRRMCPCACHQGAPPPHRDEPCICKRIGAAL